VSYHDGAGNIGMRLQPNTLNRFTYTYDAARDAVSSRIGRIDARSWVTTYINDALDRLAGIAYSAGTLVTYAFDAAGQQTLMSDWTGPTTYSYEKRGLLSNVANPTGQILTYSYDQVGNRLGMIEPGVGRMTYSYQASANFLSNLTNSYGEATLFSWNALAQLGNTTVLILDAMSVRCSVW